MQRTCIYQTGQTTPSKCRGKLVILNVALFCTGIRTRPDQEASENQEGGNMKRLLLAATALTFVTVAGIATAVQAADVPPPWAYGFAGPPPNPMPPPAAPAAPAPLDT